MGRQELFRFLTTNNGLLHILRNFKDEDLVFEDNKLLAKNFVKGAGRVRALVALLDDKALGLTPLFRPLVHKNLHVEKARKFQDGFNLIDGPFLDRMKFPLAFEIFREE